MCALRNTTVSSCSQSCFPGSATVVLRDGSRITMDRLQVGHEVRHRCCAAAADTWQVLVAPAEFSTVHGFTHKDPAAAAVFVRLTTASGAITLTPEHFLPANGVLVPAGHVQIGDLLQADDGSLTAVLAIDAPRARGLYNPHTLTGTIVVVRRRGSSSRLMRAGRHPGLHVHRRRAARTRPRPARARPLAAPALRRRRAGAARRKLLRWHVTGGPGAARVVRPFFCTCDLLTTGIG